MSMDESRPSLAAAMAQVREFHQKFGVECKDRPEIPSLEVRILRFRLIAEEFTEFKNAELRHDMVGIADALADLSYVILGTALAYGIPLAEVFDEVHRSNMTKDGDPRTDGKITKGPSYQPPRIAEILERAQ